MNAPPLLRDGVEELVGMDDQVLLFDSASGVYHRIGSLSASVVRKFDGRLTSAQITELVNAERPDSAPLDVARIEELVAGLGERHLLAGDVPQKRKRTGWDRMLPRFLVFKRFSVVLTPVVSLVRPFARPAVAALVCLIAMIGYIFGIATIVSIGSNTLATTSAGRLATSALIALAIHFLGVLLHESWHGVMAGVFDQPVRGLGVALMFWTVPVAYVDRTDAYRLRSRPHRVAIALAGMVSDGWVMGLTAVVASTTSGFAHATALALLTYQLLLLIANLNPLAPSDTVSAIESATGGVDIRGRSATLLRATVLRKPVPPYLRNMSSRRRTFHLVYGVLALVFAAWSSGFVAFALWSGITQATGW